MLDKVLLKKHLASVKTIPDVLESFSSLYTEIPDDMGLKCFHWLYWQVTQEIQQYCLDAKWKNADWLSHLDVEFYKLYVEGLLSCVDSSTPTRQSWKTLWDAQKAVGMFRIADVQYACAGICAHIGRDLPVAVMRACELTGMSPHLRSSEHADYELVNTILDAVEVRAMQRMATGSIRAVSTLMNPWDSRATMVLISRARTNAWYLGMVGYTLRASGSSIFFEKLIDSFDYFSAHTARTVLSPTEIHRARG